MLYTVDILLLLLYIAAGVVYGSVKVNTLEPQIIL